MDKDPFSTGRTDPYCNKSNLTENLTMTYVTKLGFDFHHAQSGYVMLTKWLPKHEPNKLPRCAHHYVGNNMACVHVSFDIHLMI